MAAHGATVVGRPEVVTPILAVTPTLSATLRLDGGVASRDRHREEPVATVDAPTRPPPPGGGPRDLRLRAVRRRPDVPPRPAGRRVPRAGRLRTPAVARTVAPSVAPHASRHLNGPDTTPPDHGGYDGPPTAAQSKSLRVPADALSSARHRRVSRPRTAVLSHPKHLTAVWRYHRTWTETPP